MDECKQKALDKKYNTTYQKGYRQGRKYMSDEVSDLTTRVQILTDMLEKALAQETSVDVDKENLWQMVTIQDTGLLEASFMANYLRGTIKIPREVRIRIATEYNENHVKELNTSEKHVK